MKTITTRYFLGCHYVMDATLHCIELIINVLLLFIFFLCFTLTKSDKIHHSSLEKKCMNRKKKINKNNSAYFSLFIFE